MEFGMFHEFQRRPGQTEAEAFTESFELVDAAEATGLDVMWLAELHTSPERSALAAPLSIASSIATRTKRMKIKPSNHKENRRDRRLVKNQNGKRKVVVVVRERGGRTLPTVFKTEGSAQSWIRSRVLKGSTIMADEANSWNDLHGRFQVERINHQNLYSTEAGTFTNGAESFFSRIRRAEVGHYHHIAGAYLVRYAQESAWREDHRRVDNGRQTMSLAGLAMMAPTSVDWCGYWQRSAKAA